MWNLESRSSAFKGLRCIFEIPEWVWMYEWECQLFILEHNCRFSSGTHRQSSRLNHQTQKHVLTAAPQSLHLQTAGGGGPLHRGGGGNLLPESGRWRNEGTQNPAGEPHTVSNLDSSVNEILVYISPLQVFGLISPPEKCFRNGSSSSKTTTRQPSFNSIFLIGILHCILGKFCRATELEVLIFWWCGHFEYNWSSFYKESESLQNLCSRH